MLYSYRLRTLYVLSMCYVQPFRLYWPGAPVVVLHTTVLLLTACLLNQYLLLRFVIYLLVVLPFVACRLLFGERTYHAACRGSCNEECPSHQRFAETETKYELS